MTSLKLHFTKKEAADEIDRIALQIEKDPQLYDQSVWAEDIHSCGTSHCLAGWFGANRGFVVLADSTLLWQVSQYRVRNRQGVALGVRDLAQHVIPVWAMDRHAGPLYYNTAVPHALRKIAEDLRSGTKLETAWERQWITNTTDRTEILRARGLA